MVDCDCVGPERKGTNGSPCNDTDQCAPGNICVTMMEENMEKKQTCRSLCFLANPICAPGLICQKLKSDPPYETYGACLQM